MSLRTVLKLDALVTGANGAAYLVGAGPLADLLGLSPALLQRRRVPAAVLGRRLDHRRKHAALGHKPPIARLNERTNLLGTYT